MASPKYNISLSGVSLRVEEQEAGTGVYMFPLAYSRISTDESIGLFKVVFAATRIEAYIDDILSHSSIQDLSNDIDQWTSEAGGVSEENVQDIISQALQNVDNISLVYTSQPTASQNKNKLFSDDSGNLSWVSRNTGNTGNTQDIKRSFVFPNQNAQVVFLSGGTVALLEQDNNFSGNVTLSNGKSFDIYNTVSQSTNYERFRAFYNSGTFYLQHQYGGTGQRRPIFLNVNTAGLVVNDTASVGGGIRVISNPQTANTSIFGVLGVLNGSNTTQDGATIAPYFNQSGTATGNALKVSPYLGSVGAGVNLLNLGTNTGADNTGTHTGVFVVKSDGKTGIGTDSPTHGLTLANTQEWTSYNTTAQTSNYERVRGYWSGNIYNISTEGNAAGLARQLTLSAVGNSINIGAVANVAGLINFDRSASTSGNISYLGTSGVMSNSVATHNIFALTNTVNQSGTAGYRGYFASLYEQSVGSGSKLLIDLGTNTNANGAGTHTSKFSVDNTGSIFSAGASNIFGNSTFGGGTTPTHAITLPQGASWSSYNTADQTTNFERIRGFWSVDSYYLASEKNGTGNNRAIRISATGSEFGIGGVNTSVFLNTSLSSATNSMGIFAPLLSTSSSQNSLIVAPTINQSSTAGYRVIFVSPYEQSVGSGSKLLLDFGTNSAGNGGGTHTSRFSVASNGEINFGTFGKMFSNGNFFIGSSPVDNNFKLDVNGTVRFLSNVNTIGLQISRNGGGISFFPFSDNKNYIRGTTIVADEGGDFLVGTATSISSARVVINSTTQGVLLPRMTTAQRIAISSPAVGLMVYQTDGTEGIWTYKSTGWVQGV